jgi:peptidoglycan/xylan/chitin deacetylase (PgdA/CDA1 family)
MICVIARGVHFLSRGLRRILRTPKSGALILLYHRVAQLSRDPFHLAVTPSHFAEHLDVLARGYAVISLEAILSHLDEGNISPRSVAITFDDGYSDILANAQPELAKHGMTATLFATTNYVMNQREPWWDELERLCFFPGELPRSLKIHFPQGEYSWQGTGSPPEISEHFSANQSTDWDIYRELQLTPRQSLFRGLYYPSPMSH